MRYLVQVFVLGVHVSFIAAAQAESPAVEIVRQAADGEIAGWKSYLQTPDTKTGAVWKLDAGRRVGLQGPAVRLPVHRRGPHELRIETGMRWPPSGKPGNGGVLVRLTEPHKIWPKSLEPQLNAGQAGDFWGLCGYRLSGPADRLKTVEHPTFGTLTNVKKTAELEKSPGEWNTYEIVADGGTVTLTINGTLGQSRRPAAISCPARSL